MAAELPPIINKLRVTVELTANPYRHASAALEAWGRLSITILREGTMPPFAIPLRVELFETQWDLADLAVWIAANHHALRDEHLPTDVGYPAVLPRESLAQALRRLQTREFAENEDEAAARWYDTLYRYHQHHGLQFALRGARCPDIIIGCQGQQGEISRAALLEDEAGDHAWAFLGAWAFTFDMDDFLADLEHNLIRVLTEWTLQSQEAGVHARAQSIIEQLAKHVASSGTAR